MTLNFLIAIFSIRRKKGIRRVISKYLKIRFKVELPRVKYTFRKASRKKLASLIPLWKRNCDIRRVRGSTLLLRLCNPGSEPDRANSSLPFSLFLFVPLLALNLFARLHLLLSHTLFEEEALSGQLMFSQVTHKEAEAMRFAFRLPGPRFANRSVQCQE